MRWSALLVCVFACGCGPAVDTPASSDETSGSGGSGSTIDPATSTSTSTVTSAAETTTAPDGSSSSGAPLMACFPTAVHGEIVGQHPSGLIAYAGCEDGYFVEHLGETVVTSVDDVSAIADASQLGLDEIEGLIGFGAGVCCVDSEEACIYLLLNAATFDLPVLLDQLSAAFPEADDLCFGLRLELAGNTGPRCEAEDPDCIPLPYCIEAPTCCNEATYDPDGPRLPAGNPANSEGTCEHDGDCVIHQQTSLCASWTVADQPGFGECEMDLAAAFCGCVDGECRWFEQG